MVVLDTNFVYLEWLFCFVVFFVGRLSFRSKLNLMKKRTGFDIACLGTNFEFCILLDWSLSVAWRGFFKSKKIRYRFMPWWSFRFHFFFLSISKSSRLASKYKIFLENWWSNWLLMKVFFSYWGQFPQSHDAWCGKFCQRKNWNYHFGLSCVNCLNSL